MDTPTYQESALRTESVPERIVINQRAFHHLLSALIGVAIIGDMAKRRIYYGRGINPAQLQQVADKAISELQGLRNLAGHQGEGINERIDGDTGLSCDMDRIPVRLLHCALGCYTESGEMLENLEAAYAGGQLDVTNFGEEVGDIEWYQAVGFDASGVSEASCREANVAKLRKRFADRFTAGEAVERDLAAERTALEGQAEVNAALDADDAALKPAGESWKATPVD